MTPVRRLALAAGLGLGLLGGVGCDLGAVRQWLAVEARPAETGRVRGQGPALAATVEPTSSPVLAATVERSPAPEPVTREPFEMTFVGDVIFGRYRAEGYDPIPKDESHEVFGEVAELMRSDLLVGNLETPVVEQLPAQSPTGARYSFGADARLAEQLVHGGFGAVSLANNHAYDLHAEGVAQTPEILARLGVVALGAARHEGPALRVETIERRGWRVGFVAATTQTNIDGLAGLPPLPLVDVYALTEQLSPLVTEARSSHDLVVVLLHWGDEYAEAPSWIQRQTAYDLVEAGADLVIGHHPHVLQGIETHGRGLIAYSLGNFVFENVHEVPRQSAVLRTRFDARGCLQAAIVHPVFVKSVPFKHPAPAVGHMGGKVKQRVRALAQPMGTRWRDEGDALALEGLQCPAPPARSADPSVP